MPSDALIFEKLLRKSAEVLDPTNPAKHVCQDVVKILDEKKKVDNAHL